ncbi:MAG: RNA polymerase sigma factor [Bacteroidota bacterium]
MLQATPSKQENLPDFYAILENAKTQLFLPAIRLTKNEDAAKDLIQETVLKALLNKEKFQEGTNLKAWLFIIMRNTFITQYHRNNKVRPFESSSQFDYFANSADLSETGVEERKLREKELLSHINNLPEIYRKSFNWYVEGYKYREIADMLQIPIGTVKHRIHVARKILKKGIEKQQSFVGQSLRQLSYN